VVDVSIGANRDKPSAMEIPMAALLATSVRTEAWPR